MLDREPAAVEHDEFDFGLRGEGALNATVKLTCTVFPQTKGSLILC